MISLDSCTASRVGLCPRQPAHPKQGGFPQGDAASSSANETGRRASPPRCITAGGFFMPVLSLPISTLIEERCRELGLRGSEIAARCGYKNLSKGVRRLDQVLAGNFHKGRYAYTRFTEGTEPRRQMSFSETIDKTVRQIAQNRRPFGVRALSLLPISWARPTGLRKYSSSESRVGSERWLKIPLDLSQPPVELYSASC